MLEYFVRRFERYLESHGKRLSQMQRIVARIVFESDSSFTAEDICSSVKSADPPIGRASVYRTLRFFEAAGLVTAFRRGGACHYRVVGFG